MIDIRKGGGTKKSGGGRRSGGSSSSREKEQESERASASLADEGCPVDQPRSPEGARRHWLALQPQPL